MNRGYEYTEQLDVRARGMTVLEYLAGRYRHSSLEVWRERLERGEVTVDGVVASPALLLLSGQILCWTRPPWHEPEVPLRYDVVHEDADLLVVSKPAGLPCQPAGGFFAHTLLALVRERDSRWDLMHRLGRGTSGLVVFARTAQARAGMQRAWREGLVEKRYRALASGVLPAEPFEIAAPIGRVAHSRLGEIHAFDPGGKPARSIVVRMAVRGPDSLVEVQILTGRPHQIRIHLAFAGHPLEGDPLYGPGGVPKVDALPGELGYLLHAHRLTFEHPCSGKRLALEAPLPRELEG